MKYIIAVLFAFFAFASATRFRYELNDATEECLKDLNVPDELIQKYGNSEFPDDETTRCYILCVYDKLDFFDVYYGFKTDNMIAQLTQGRNNEEEIIAAIEKCADHNNQGSDNCTWAYRVFKCYEHELLPSNV